jgi:N-acetylneuraminate synthase
MHDGNFESAKELIELAKTVGADVVKFQTHIAEAETLRDAPNPPYFTGEPRFEYFKRTAFTLEQWKALKAHAETQGIEFLSSPFSIEAVDLLEQVGVKRYKIPSGEVTNIPYLERVGRTRKPVLLSSGMSSWAELDEAVAVLRKAGCKDLTVLQCTSEYPCLPENVGLNILGEMRERYKLPVGFSDHTMTNEAAFAAVALGATVIEKHLTSSRNLYGSDAAHSLEPNEFADLVRGIRSLEQMLAHPVDMTSTERFAQMKAIFEKSVVSVRDIAKGTVITAGMVGVKKPGTGIPAKRLREVIGKRARRDIPQDSLLSGEDFE